jgi:hypothetical protein
LTTPKSNGDKSQTYHRQTQSKNIGDKVKKFQESLDILYGQKASAELSKPDPIK